MSLARLGGVYALLHASHEVADHWLQSDPQALHKGDDGPGGRRACAAHVATLTAAHGAALAAGCAAAGERVSSRRALLGLGIIAVSHYAADRREHGALPWAIGRLHRLGKHNLYTLGDGKAAPCGTGAYALDQAWHVGWLAIAAAVIAGGR